MAEYYEDRFCDECEYCGEIWTCDDDCPMMTGNYSAYFESDDEMHLEEN